MRDSLALPAARGDARGWLRDLTRSEHEATERTVLRELSPLDLRSYTRYLQRLLPLYLALEPELEHALAGALRDARERIKSPWLIEDLHALGEPPVASVAPDLAEVKSALATRLGALGVAYVLEGATLGGPILLAQLQRAGLSVDARSGARFLTGYGSDAPRMWRAFCAELEAAAAREHEWRALGEGARATFRVFGAFIGGGRPAR